MHNIKWIIFLSQLRSLLIGTGLYLIFYWIVRGEWPLISALIFWLLWFSVMWVSWKEERMNLAYWIRPHGSDSVRNALLNAGFTEICQEGQYLLYRKKRRWRKPYFALLSTGPSFINLEIAEKFEPLIDEYITADFLYRPRGVPDRRHWLLRALYQSRNMAADKRAS